MKDKKIERKPLREALKNLIPVVEAFFNRKPAPQQIMTWNKEDVVYDDADHKRGRVPSDKVKIIEPRKVYEEALQALEQSIGYWAFIKYDLATCSACGETIPTHFDTTEKAKKYWMDLYPYCPHCGAKMEYKKPNIKKRK